MIFSCLIFEFFLKNGLILTLITEHRCTVICVFAFYVPVCHFQTGFKLNSTCLWPRQPSSAEWSLSVKWHAGRHQESVFTLEVPGNEFPHTNSHLSYQPVNVLPQWLKNTFKTFKKKKSSKLLPLPLMHSSDQWGDETASCHMRAPTFSCCPGCTFFKLAECICSGWPRWNI